MAINVYGNTLSTATMRVLACLTEKDLEYEFVHVDMATDEHKKEPHLSRNPFGQVPAFEDGDLKLFESRAITRYISFTYAEKGTPLISLDPKEMAIMSVWMEVEAMQYEPAASKLTWEYVIKPVIGIDIDDAVVQECETNLAQVLDIYEGRLAESKYLGGDFFTLADLHHIPTVKCLMDTRIKSLFHSRPHVSAWCADILARPAWNKVSAI